MRTLRSHQFKNKVFFDEDYQKAKEEIFEAVKNNKLEQVLDIIMKNPM